MLVDGSPVQIAYMRFDVASLAGRHIQSAVLQLKISNDTSTGIQTVSSVANTSWNERTMTYNSRPALGSALVTFSGTKANTWITIDLTNYVVAMQGQQMSIGIGETSADSLNIYSKESSTNQPVLIVVSTSN